MLGILMTGSQKIALEFAGGYDVATGVTRKSQTRTWNYTMGGGYTFSRRLSVLAEYTYNHSRIPQRQFGAGNGIGDVHLWSATIEPVVHLYNAERFGIYAVGGAGFYPKLTIFPDAPCSTNPCDISSLDLLRLSNNAVGTNLGMGLSVRLSQYSNMKFFAEARYVWIDNQPSQRNLLYPPANQRTSYLPITGGPRW